MLMIVDKPPPPPSTASCDPECQNGGTCIARDQCSCPPKWGGVSCEVPLCVPVCQNDGRCVVWSPGVHKCACFNNWIGIDCNTRELTHSNKLFTVQTVHVAICSYVGH